MKTQSFKRGVEKLDYDKGISKSKAQNKPYWKNEKAFHKQKVFKQKSLENANNFPNKQLQKQMIFKGVKTLL